jgi:hypothetical protein
MTFDEISLLASLRTLFTAYFLSCLCLLGMTYCGQWTIAHLETNDSVK